jgi:hypothetical protein
MTALRLDVKTAVKLRWYGEQVVNAAAVRGVIESLGRPVAPYAEGALLVTAMSEAKSEVATRMPAEHPYPAATSALRASRRGSLVALSG